MLTRDEFQSLYEQGPEALWSAFAELQSSVVAQQEQVQQLLAQVQELKNRLDKDSHNSHKPPASDGLGKKPVSLRPTSGRKPGGQPGHRGRTLEFSPHPDHTQIHSPPCCGGCGSSLEEVPVLNSERRQVVDLPPLALEVTEHRSEYKVCPACGCPNRGIFPAEVTAPVQYGPRVKALDLYLLDYQLLPYARIASFFADLFDASLSAGMLFEAQHSASTHLEPVVAAIRQALQKAALVHFDETGFRVEGVVHWLHSASTASLTAYAWHKKRGKAGMDAADVFPSFTGRAVHDGYPSYQQYTCSHALCNAHHLRELTALYEQTGAQWAKAMRHLLVAIKDAVEIAKQHGKLRLSVLQEAPFEGRYRQLLKQGFAANPPPAPVPDKQGRPKQSTGRNLLERLQNEEQVLAFMYDFAVPFDNNQAERDIRMMKLQQKISGCFRSRTGAEAFCRIRSYIGTLQKQGQRILSAREHVFRGTPVYPQLTG